MFSGYFELLAFNFFGKYIHDQVKNLNSNMSEFG